MNDVIGAQQIVGTAGQSTAASGGASRGLSSDFETFLTMLTVQMENQDPLNPIDSTDYAVQLATFSGVEQQVQTNDLLTSLAQQLSANGLAEMASWVGMEARAAVPAYYDGQSPITLAPNPVAVADQVELVVFDQWGTEVSRQSLPVSADPYEWAGTTGDGTPLPTGTYRFELASYAGEELLSQDPVDVYTMITEIQSDGVGTVLVLEGGATVAAGAISALRDPT